MSELECLGHEYQHAAALFSSGSQTNDGARLYVCTAV